MKQYDNSNSTMETSDHSKNGVTGKKTMSKQRKFVIGFLVGMIIGAFCGVIIYKYVTKHQNHTIIEKLNKSCPIYICGDRVKLDSLTFSSHRTDLILNYSLLDTLSENNFRFLIGFEIFDAIVDSVLTQNEKRILLNENAIKVRLFSIDKKELTTGSISFDNKKNKSDNLEVAPDTN